jgi:hypothetical protein
VRLFWPVGRSELSVSRLDHEVVCQEKFLILNDSFTSFSPGQNFCLRMFSAPGLLVVFLQKWRYFIMGLKEVIKNHLAQDVFLLMKSTLKYASK